MKKTLTAILLSLFSGLPFLPLPGANKPNIILFLVDDMGWMDCGVYGSKYYETPHMDRLAREGMIFHNSFCTNSICGPSRAVILTGKYSHLNGFFRNGRTPFDGSQQTFPKLLRKVGYETAMVGKWHLKSVPTGYAYFDVLIGQGP